MLRRGNCKPEIANWVAKHFRCPECEANKRPKSRRPTAVPKTYRFNHVVGIDLVDVKYEGITYHWLNALCWGSGLQLVYPVVGDGAKTPENVWETFVDSWSRIFAMPEIIVMDPGTEFKAHFAEMAAGNGSLVLPTDPRAPWQNGRTERAGKEWKIQFRLARDKEMPQNFREWRVLGLQCCASRNQYQNRSGFSPRSRRRRSKFYSTRPPTQWQTVSSPTPHLWRTRRAPLPPRVLDTRTHRARSSHRPHRSSARCARAPFRPLRTSRESHRSCRHRLPKARTRRRTRVRSDISTTIPLARLPRASRARWRARRPSSHRPRNDVPMTTTRMSRRARSSRAAGAPRGPGTDPG